MQIQLEFDHIHEFNGEPKISVRVNGIECYNNVVENSVEFVIDDTNDCVLEIEHYGKNNNDTEVIDNVIVNDKNFTLKNIIIDGYNIEELKWESDFTDVHGNIIPSCLFFGPNGIYRLHFQLPVLKWILSTRHSKNNNDPNWEEDYNYYMQAVNLLKEFP
jgi:hypothetical protein